MLNPFKRKREAQALRERELALAEQEAANEAARLKLRNRAFKVMQDDIERAERKKNENRHTMPVLPTGVVPTGKTAPIAMDSCGSIYDYAGNSADISFYPSFLGYPALAMLTQSSDYRSVPETTASEMTREWGEFKVDLAQDQSPDDTRTDAQIDADNLARKVRHAQVAERCALLADAFDEMDIRSLVRRTFETEMSMGRAQIYVDIGQRETDNNPLLLSSRAIGRDSLKGFTLVEPMWSTPSVYNANDPTAADFFKPTKWFVMGREVHSDRLLTVITRPVPQMLLPSYNFGGISMLQLMKPYVERYQRTADSTADLVHSFSLTILSTDMSNILTGGGYEDYANLQSRMGIFNSGKTNSGMMVLDKEDEEITQINTALTGLPELLTKMQEQMAGPSHTPLVKLLGVTPSGLNASSEGEIEVYRDYIMAQNEAHARPLIEWIARIMQLSMFGEIEPAIKWEFNPLKQLDSKELAETQEAKGRNAVQLVQAGIVSEQEARQTLAEDKTSPFVGIDVDNLPVTDSEPMGGEQWP